MGGRKLSGSTLGSLTLNKIATAKGNAIEITMISVLFFKSISFYLLKE